MKSRLMLPLACLVFPSLLHAAQWDDVQKQAIERYQAKQYDQAAQLAQQAITLAEKEYAKQPAYLASSLNSLALIENERGNKPQALELMERAITLNEKALGVDHANMAAMWFNLGSLLHSSGQLDKADAAYQRALAIRDKQPKPATREILQVLDSRNYLALERKDYAQVEAVSRRILQLAQADSKEGQQARASASSLLAQALQAQQRNDDVEALYQQALELRRQALGEQHPEVTRDIARLANYYDQQGQHERAAPLHQQALSIRQQTGEGGLESAQHLNELALGYHQQGELDKARPLYRQVLAILEGSERRESRETALVLGSMAALEQAQKENKAALELYQRSLELFRKIGGYPEEQAQMASNLGSLYFAQRKFKEAEPLLLEALALQEQAYGKEAQELLISLENLNALYRTLNQNSKADPYARRAAELKRAAARQQKEG